MTRVISLKKELSPSDAGLRIDVVIAKMFPEFSRTHIQKWIKGGYLKLNGKKTKPKFIIEGKEVVSIEVQEEELSSDKPEDIKLNILWEDKDILIINKPPNLVVHPGAGNKHGTLVNGLLHYDKDLSYLPRAGIVHRLDKNTSGVMIVTKNEHSYLHLIKQFKERAVSREYLAIVIGELISGGIVDKPLGRHPRYRTKQAVLKGGKEAITHFTIADKFKGHSLLKISLKTGRTHQIRVHLSYIGFPIIGDSTYGGRSKFAPNISQSLRESIKIFKRQALHASSVKFTHPRNNKKINVDSELPKDMTKLIKSLKRDEK